MPFKMKRIAAIFVLMLLAVASPVAFAQVQLTTKKEKLSDFKTKTMYVVRSGNDFLDQEIRSATKDAWILSPYEFISSEEFSRMRSSDSYYFMVPVDVSKGEGDTGLTFLTIVKGTKDAKEVDDMLEVVTFPICAAKSPSGREAYMLPSILDILQNYIERCLSKGFLGGVASTGNLSRTSSWPLYITEGDLSGEISQKYRSKKFSQRVKIVSESEQADAMDNVLDDALIGYAIYPSEPSAHSMCYKMIVDVRGHELYYFRRHKYSSKEDGGFLREDLSKIISGR